MAKYHDIDGMGKSKLCPKVKDESNKDRHWRRKNFNIQGASVVQQFCVEHNLKISITNFGHHWRVINKDGKIIEWWPASAKVIINKLWQRGIHVHDYQQFIELLKKRFRLPEK